jgi:hypothetical protein
VTAVSHWIAPLYEPPIVPVIQNLRGRFNPRKCPPRFFEAKDSDFITETQSIYRIKSHASAVIIPVLNAK